MKTPPYYRLVRRLPKFAYKIWERWAYKTEAKWNVGDLEPKLGSRPKPKRYHKCVVCDKDLATFETSSGYCWDCACEATAAAARRLSGSKSTNNDLALRMKRIWRM